MQLLSRREYSHKICWDQRKTAETSVTFDVNSFNPFMMEAVII